MEPKTQTYSAISGLNEAADLFLERLNKLHKLTILSPQFAEARKLAVELARAEVNHASVLALSDIERDHCHETEQTLIHLNAKLKGRIITRFHVHWGSQGLKSLADLFIFA